MQIMKKLVSLSFMLLLPWFLCMAASPKRGLGWQGGSNDVNAHHAELLAPGIAWVYNWGPDTSNPDIYGEDFYFVPMAWNGSFNESRIRTWLTNHPETKYLLGFNEPNFADQAAMTPAQAAAKWPALEKIAGDFNVKLVGPAMNFSGSQVGGKVWGIYEWLDEFFRLMPEAKVDCLAAHCYMNWTSSFNWFATEYFYKDLFNSDNKGKYPYLVKYMDNFKASNGHYPKMMLTEFCAWEYDGSITGVDFQIDQMTQKVQLLEKSDLVEGYAWFMGNAGGGAKEFPYMSVLETNTKTSGLSELGNVYVHMSSFDTSRFYGPGETIMAKDYVNATRDNSQIKLRSNSEVSSSVPLQIEIPKSGYGEYQLNVPMDGTYKFTYHVKADRNSTITLYIDNKKDKAIEIEATGGSWKDVEFETTLQAGKYRIMPYNTGSEPVFMNTLRFDYGTGINGAETDAEEHSKVVEVYNLQGISLGNPEIEELPRGFFVLRKSDGSTVKLCR